MYAYQEPSESDDRLTWPLYGKQITMGIVEQGKPIEERVTMRRSLTTEQGMVPKIVNIFEHFWSLFGHF